MCKLNETGCVLRGTDGNEEVSEISAREQPICFIHSPLENKLSRVLKDAQGQIVSTIF